jgi:hypothetical protein
MAPMSTTSRIGARGTSRDGAVQAQSQRKSEPVEEGPCPPQLGPCWSSEHALNFPRNNQQTGAYRDQSAIRSASFAGMSRQAGSQAISSTDSGEGELFNDSA